MSQHYRHSSIHSEPRHVPAPASPAKYIRAASPQDSALLATPTARLASPVHSLGTSHATPVRQIPTPSQLNAQDPSQFSPALAGARGLRTSLPGHGESALANAFKESFKGRSPPQFAKPPLRPLSPESSGSIADIRGVSSNYESLQPSSQGRVGGNSPVTAPDPQIVRRHLAGPTKGTSSELAGKMGTAESATGLRSLLSSMFGRKSSRDAANEGNDEFSSLQLQGGDIHRQVYRWTEQQEAMKRAQRSKSFSLARRQPEDGKSDYQSIREPGGFRREYLGRAAGTASPLQAPRPGPSQPQSSEAGTPVLSVQPFTSNFMEFLTLYGHFAGETIDDEEDEGLEYLRSDADVDETRDENDQMGEESALLGRRGRRKKKSRTGKQGVGFTLLSLLKGFVGTGVLFLPRAFLNGGMLFSSLMLLSVAALSYYCFLLLTKTRLTVKETFGNMGKVIYGRWLLILINFSLVISQIGFTSAYIVFTSENLQAFILAVSKCRTFIPINLIILMQLAVFLPLSLYRNIGNLGKVALIADLFILAGLIYVYFYDIKVITERHGFAPDIALFNRDDWTLFIGTAIFTFEGIGLLIPIQEGMKDQTKFPLVLVIVMVIITTVFTSMGALSYAAYGSKTKTVIISNMPQDNKLVNSVQFLYSLAILLSTPLQVFPVITILEKGVFKRKSGKKNAWVKWQKNVFRFFIVVFCAGVAWGGANDLDKFVALVGSFACVPLVYVYPPLLHYRAVATRPWQRSTDIALIIFGIAIMGYTTVLTVMSWIQGVDHKEPGYCDR